MIALVRRELVTVLRLDAAPAVDTGFFDLGMDSLMSVALRTRLQAAFGREFTVPDTVVFDYPNVTALARYLSEQFGEAPAESPPLALPAPAVGDGERVAIVGMACRFPGGEDFGKELGADLGAFRDLLRAGGFAVTRGRPDGLFVDEETEAARPFGAYVGGMDRFDAEFFRIAPVEAELLDPQQRLLLEVSWEALEHAGLATANLRGSRTGVYAGIMTHDYRDLLTGLEEDPSRGFYPTSGVAAAAAVGRVAFALGLEGAGDHRGHGVFFIAGGGAPGGGGPSSGRGGSGARRRGQRDPAVAVHGSDGGRGDAGGRRPLQDVRRVGGRLRARGGVRHGGAEAPRGRGARRGTGCWRSCWVRR